MNITREIAEKVLSVVDTGLVHGLGRPIPGEMCVEAAVCYALDLPHGDEPTCVSPALRSLKIHLNDSNWSSNQARAKGLRRLALAQLGSAIALNDQEFSARVAGMTIRTSVAIGLRIAASMHSDIKHRVALLAAAKLCETAGSMSAAESAESAARSAARSAESAASAARSAARSANCAAESAARSAKSAARSAAWSAESAAWSAESAAWSADCAARSATYDSELSDYAERVVQILIAMNAPGCQWLDLAPIGD